MTGQTLATAASNHLSTNEDDSVFASSSPSARRGKNGDRNWIVPLPRSS